MTGAPERLARWGLTADGEPAPTVAGVVQFVRRGEQRLVLKQFAGADEAAQAAALALWEGHGAVRVAEVEAGALLMERAWPGTPLSGLAFEGNDDAATHAVCDVIAVLHRDPAPGGFRTVEDWGQGFDRVRARALAEGADAAMIDPARALYDDLCRSQGDRFLLHGDLHHDNILWDDGRGWLAIDPKGVVGELAYETGCMLRNPGDQPKLYADPGVITRRAAILAERLGLDLERILGWCFAQAVLSALWSVEDGRDPSRGWRTAQATRPLL